MSSSSWLLSRNFTTANNIYNYLGLYDRCNTNDTTAALLRNKTNICAALIRNNIYMR